MTNAAIRQWGENVTNNIKIREKQFDHTLEPQLPIVVRLDGCGFKSFTKPLNQFTPSALVDTGSDNFTRMFDKKNSEGKKAFDIRFTRSMISTCMDMVDHFSASIGYTISDEITLVIPPAEFPDENSESPMYDSLKERDPKGLNKNREHFYNGRQSKINSITSAYATARFNYHFHNDHCFADMATHTVQDKKPKIERVSFPDPSHLGYFDARTMTVESADEVLDLIAWRQRFDGERNVINRIGQYVYGHKQVTGHSKSQISDQVMQELKLRILAKTSGLIGERIPHNFDQHDLTWFRKDQDVYEVRPEIGLGVLVKKEKILLEAVNQKTKQPVQVERGRLCCRSLQLPTSESNREEYLRMVFSKYWPSQNSS